MAAAQYRGYHLFHDIAQPAHPPHGVCVILNEHAKRHLPLAQVPTQAARRAQRRPWHSTFNQDADPRNLRDECLKTVPVPSPTPDLPEDLRGYMIHPADAYYCLLWKGDFTEVCSFFLVYCCWFIVYSPILYIDSQQ